MIQPSVLFEDDSIIVLEKPSGWITNSAITTKDQPVIEDWLAKNFNFPIFNDLLLRHGIVHRLDKETSGILIVAKTSQAFENLQAQFKERIIKKNYQSLVHGKVTPSDGLIKVDVGRLPWRRDRFGIIPDGRESETEYKTIKHFKNIKTGEIYTHLLLIPKTGRTHQIRIHLKHIGFPVVGDNFYAGRKRSRNDRKWVGRLFLHASSITFIHPISKEEIKIESDLPQDLRDKVIENLQELV